LPVPDEARAKTYTSDILTGAIPSRQNAPRAARGPPTFEEMLNYTTYADHIKGIIDKLDKIMPIPCHPDVILL
jgi:hypothetical protein